jgi:uncharacterized protein (DUF1499 family)
MRRLIIEEPVSRPALWSPRLAAFSLTVTLIAVGLLRFGWVDPNSGLAALGMGLAVAGLAILASLLAFVMIWREGRRGLGSAVRGLMLASIVLAWPAYHAVRSATLPALNDISTDIENPPSFSRSRAALDQRGGRVPPDLALERRRAQREGYARIAPLTLDVAPEEAFELVRRAAANQGWRILEATRPGGRMGDGRLDAVATTFLLRLPDDVTVRVRPRADGARVDVRSASRIGRHDLGANAARIRAFLDEVATLAIAL